MWAVKPHQAMRVRFARDLAGTRSGATPMCAPRVRGQGGLGPIRRCL